MPIIYHSRPPKIIWSGSIFLFLFSVSGFSGYLDIDPIKDTQTKPVSADEEVLKKEEIGAPAPTFKLVEDTGDFFVQSPFERLKGKEESSTEDSYSSDDEREKEASEEDGDFILSYDRI